MALAGRLRLGLRPSGCAEALSQAAQHLGAPGMTFGRAGGCADLQARRCSSPSPPEESPEGPGVGGGGIKDNLNERMARVEVKIDHLEKVQETVLGNLGKLMAGETPFFKALKDDINTVKVDLKALEKDTRAALRWQQHAAGFAACAGMVVAYALRHTLFGM